MNVERHSGATKVTVDLRGHARGATLRVADNGKGLPTNPGAHNPGIGLRNMQERIERLDGTLRILSSRAPKERGGGGQPAAKPPVAPR